MKEDQLKEELKIGRSVVSFFTSFAIFRQDSTPLEPLKCAFGRCIELVSPVRKKTLNCKLSLPLHVMLFAAKSYRNKYRSFRVKLLLTN